MRMRRISDREIKLLLVVLILAILFGAYQSGYQRFHKKALGLKNENSNMIIQKNELLQKQLKRDKILAETAELKSRTDLILSKFPPVLTQEGNMMFIIYLTQLSGMKLTSISFHDISLFYTPDRTSEASSFDAAALTQDGIAVSGNDSVVSREGTALSNNDSIISQSGTAAARDAAALIRDGTAAAQSYTAAARDYAATEQEFGKGYKAAVTINYQATYSGLKKCISHVIGNEVRMNISELTASFDNATGNLTGMMTLQMYALDGIAGNYEEPAFDGIAIGTDNIFSTLELQAEE